MLRASTRRVTPGMVVADTFYRDLDGGAKDWINPADVDALVANLNAALNSASGTAGASRRPPPSRVSQLRAAPALLGP